MTDQADKLRQLVIDSAPSVRADAALPPTIVVTGGKGGVGTTTVAVNLAAALAQSGRRTVLVDAAPHADAAHVLGVEIERGLSLDHVVTGAVSAFDALHAGPAGISLLSGQWAPEQSPDRSPRSVERLLEQLPALELHADVLVIDSGCGATSWTRRFWEEAVLVLLVTTPDDMAVMDAYATIKRCIDSNCEVDLRVLVNACHDTSTAVDVQSRLAAACRRFLNRSIGRAPLLPRHIGELGAGNAPPLAWDEPSSPFARNVHQLGRFAGDVLAHRKRKQRAGGSLSLDPSHTKLEICAC
jgi:flagellar biosynthesis protein FlhG